MKTSNATGGEVIKTSCGLCCAGCGMDVHVQAGKIVKVTGNREHLKNRGVLCPKGSVARDYFYSPNRIKYPMKRENGDWKRVSWEEALEEISNRLGDIRETHGARALGVLMGMVVLMGGTATVELIQRFCDAFGTPNVFSVDSLCYRVRWMADFITFGKIPVADPENAQCIIMWGYNPHDSDPPFVKHIQRGMEKGAKLIIIDPRRTALADRADIHAKPRPGSDGALAISFLNVIISEKLYDQKFVEKWTVGFEKLAEHVKAYPPEEVEKITWVPAQTIRDIARAFAAAKPACILQGTQSLDETASGFQINRAIAILQAVTGNTDVKGGFVTPEMGGDFTPSFMPLTFVRMPEKWRERPLGAKEYPLYFDAMGKCLGEGQGIVLSEVIAKGEPYPLKSMILAGCNPALNWPDSTRTQQMLKQLDFLVVIDPFMSETAKLAHIVLPAGTYLERTDIYDYYWAWGLPYIALRNRTAEFYEARSDIRIWLEMGKRLTGKDNFPWNDEEDYLDHMLKPTGLTVEKLRKEHPNGFTIGSFSEYKQYEKNGFETPSGKIELYCEGLAKMGYDPMPVYIEPGEGPKTKGLADEYPLILTTGTRRLQFTHSQLRDIPVLRRKVPDALAEVNPETAGKYGIKDGDMAILETPRGSIEVKMSVTESIIPGIVSMPHGWANANANVLTSMKPSDPVSGYPGFRSLLCRIGKKA